MENDYYFKSGKHNRIAFIKQFNKKSYIFIQFERNNNLLYLIQTIKMPYFAILSSKYISIGKVVRTISRNRELSLYIISNFLDLLRLVNGNHGKIKRIGYSIKGIHNLEPHKGVRLIW